MSFEGYKQFLAERGIRSVITSSGKFVSTSGRSSNSYAGYGYAGYGYAGYGGISMTYAPSVGGAIGVRGKIPRLIVISGP
jgi:hypothetical protein